jgi:hypothetical protein
VSKSKVLTAKLTTSTSNREDIMKIHQYAIRTRSNGERIAVPFGEVDAQRDIVWHRCESDPEHNGLDTEGALLVVNRWNYLAATTYSKVDYVYYLPIGANL